MHICTPTSENKNNYQMTLAVFGICIIYRNNVHLLEACGCISIFLIISSPRMKSSRTFETNKNTNEFGVP